MFYAIPFVENNVKLLFYSHSLRINLDYGNKFNYSVIDCCCLVDRESKMAETQVVISQIVRFQLILVQSLLL